jgi:hypothetical protein
MAAERHNQDIFGFHGSQRSPANLTGLEHGQGVTEIESFALGVTFGSVVDRHPCD